VFSPLHVDTRGRELAARLDAVGVSGAVVTSSVNLRWLTGFTGSAGTLVVGAEVGSSMVLVTDGRYVEQAARETAAARADVVVVERRSQIDIRAAVAAHMASMAGRAGRWALETSDITLAEFEALQVASTPAGVALSRSHVVDVS